MIIAVSIVDKHRPAGDRHVGTYMFEVDYPGDSHFDLFAVVAPVENEDILRPDLNKLQTVEEIKDPMTVTDARYKAYLDQIAEGLQLGMPTPVNEIPDLMLERLRKAEEGNPCKKIFEHNHLDPMCVEEGCKSLFLEEAVSDNAKLLVRIVDLEAAIVIWTGACNNRDKRIAELESALAEPCDCCRELGPNGCRDGCRCDVAREASA